VNAGEALGLDIAEQPASIRSGSIQTAIVFYTTLSINALR
jgi:hypothetical protein